MPPKQDYEIRFTDAEFKVEKRDDSELGKTLVGYAALFNVDAQLGYGFTERIAPGAFTNALKRKDDVRALFNHDANHILGRTTAGTLELWEDTKGLGFRVVLPETQFASDLSQSIARGDINQCSFAFIPDGENWDEKNKGNVIRTITDVQLFDVSAVTYPAYEQTRVSLRAIDKYKELNTSDVDSLNTSDDEIKGDPEVGGDDMALLEILEKELNLKEKELIQ